MEIRVYSGWPLRYAHVVVEGIKAEHAANGIICLWAEDDPAQVAGRDLQVLWDRIDEWAETANDGFRAEDRALDAYLLFEERNGYEAELPFVDLVQKGTNGYLAPLAATKQGEKALMIALSSDFDPVDSDADTIRGAFYLRRDIGEPPRSLEDIASALTKRQRADLDRGLVERAPSALGVASGGYDFIVLAWPRHGAEHDAVVVGFEGNGDSLRASAMSATPNDAKSRRRRAGPDADSLSSLTVLVAGVGSVGGHVAVALASSGVGTIRLHDSDYLKSGNLVRHVSSRYFVGYSKTTAVALEISHHAPWTVVEQFNNLSYDPTLLTAEIDRVDLVVDCTGVFSVSAALAEACRRYGVPLISGALFHQGALGRVQRQAAGDTPIAARPVDSSYLDLPSDDPSAPESGFLELGCTAPIINAPPISVLSIAADIAHAAVDLLTNRRDRSDERILVFRSLPAPFEQVGALDAPRPVDGRF